MRKAAELGAQPLFSRAYAPLLPALLTESRTHKTPDAMKRPLQRAGDRTRVVESCDRDGPPNCQFRVPTPG